jgi:hypothetical protein
MKRTPSLLPVLVVSVLWLAAGAPRVTGQGAGAPPLFVQGPTVSATVRNGIEAASDQARLTAKTASDMGARARSTGYQLQNLEADYHNLQLQFQNLRAVMQALTGVASQGQSARAANAAAELEAGLNIIAEAFGPVQQEIQARTVNRDTVVRMCQVLSEALKEWNKELQSDNSRLGTAR